MAMNSARQRSIRSEIPGQCIPQRSWLALLSQPVEEQLMEDHRVHCDQLLALEPVDEKAGGLGVLNIRELLLDEIETLHCSAVLFS